MTLSERFVCGTIGALTLTLLHEIGRKTLRHAPHMDFVGMRAIAKMLRRLGYAPQSITQLRNIALAGDLTLNALYYGLVIPGAQGPATSIWKRSLFFGTCAGLGGAFLPPKLGLRNPPEGSLWTTHVLTICIYTFAGAAAASTAQTIQKVQQN